MVIQFPSGEQAEVVSADTYSGPNQCFSRQHANGTSTFVRRVGDPDSAWRRVQVSKSLHTTLRWAEVADTFDEYAEVVGAELLNGEGD